MDEIELLRRVRANQPEPTQAAVEAGRNALLQRAARAKTEPLTGPAEKRCARARSRVFWGIGVFAAAGAAATALILAATLQPGPPAPVVGSSSTPVSSSLLSLTGPELLNTAAEKIRAAGDEQLLPGQYLRVDRRDIEMHHVPGDPQTPSWTLDYSESLYIPADKNDEWIYTQSENSIETFTEAGAAEYQTFLDTLEEQGQPFSSAQYQRAERGDFVDVAGVGSEMLTFDWADEPEGVLDQLYELDKNNVEPEAQAFSRISGLIEPGYLTAGDRALLLETAAIIPSVDAAVTLVKIHGISGVAVTLQDGTAVEQQLIFDATTGLPIGRQVISDTDSGSGWGLNTTTYTYEVVSSAPQE